MHPTIKNLLGISLILVLITLSVGLGFTTLAISSGVNRVESQEFTVSGEAEVQAVPDVAIFTYTVLDEGSMDVAELQKNNTEVDTSIVDYLKENGVEDKDIKTLSYNVDPQRSYEICEPGKECGPDKIVSYTVRKVVRVKVRDIDDAGQFVAVVVEEGADSVSNLRFEIDDEEKYQNQAREEAIAKAREKAEGMAKAGKFKVGKLTYIDEGYYSGSNDYAYEESYLQAVPMAKSIDSEYTPDPTPIQVGESTISASVTLTFEMK